jgi:putative ABC transport system permease protein
MVWEANKRRLNAVHNVISPANFLDWRAQNDVFSTITAFADRRAVFSDGQRVEELQTQLIGADLLPMLGVQPLRGRLFTAAEDRPGTGTAVLISHRLWQTWFGGDESIVGRKVEVNSTPRTIIGVMPPGFYFRNRETDFWMPIGLDPAQDYRKTAGRFLLCAARLKPGVTIEQAQAQMTAIAARLEAAYPAFDTNWTVNVESLRESLVRDVKTSLFVLLGAVSLLLAVACANVANLLLARYTSRRREMAVRTSLGAARGRLVRQLLTESVLLGLAGGALGVVLARWAVAGLINLAPAELTRSALITFDLRIILAAVGVSILTGIVFGLAPSFVASRTGIAGNLRHDDRSSVGAGGRLRLWLVGAEVALSVVLLAGAGLLFRSLIELQAVDPGLNANSLLTFRVTLPLARYQAPERRVRFFAEAVERIERVPGVQSASAISFIPFTGLAAGTWINIAGRPTAKPGEELGANIRTVLPGYFRTIGIPLSRGRDFSAADNTGPSPYRFIVNEAFVKRYFPHEEPLGKSINVLMDRQNPFGEIIGVVGDVKEGALDKAPEPTVYYVHAHLTYNAMTFLVRTAGDPLAIGNPVRQIISRLDPAQPIAEVRTMDDILANTFARQRFSTILLISFSLAALVLAAVGIYGVLAYSVSERTREIGVRVALGAEPGRIVSLVIRMGAAVAGAGLLVGLAGALAVSSVLKTLLFGIEPRDPLTFAFVPAVLLGVALTAAYLPARRAARLDPMQALRVE